MLILVGVTINVAIQGGLFTSARKGAYQTQASIIKEQLEVEKATIVANNNGNIPNDFGIGTIDNLDISQDLKDEFGSKLTISTDGTLYYTDVVTDKQEQSWLEEIGILPYGDPPEDDLFRKYILGQDETGRPILEILDLAGFKDDELTEDVDETQTLGVEILTTFVGEEGAKFVYYVKYDNKAYKIICDSIFGNTESLELKYTPKELEGANLGEISGDNKYNDWTILYNNGNTLEAVGPISDEKLVLGYEDTTVNWENTDVIAEADIDGNKTLEDIEKAIYSYNHAIDTINNFCKEQVDDNLLADDNVRSVGAKTDITEEKYIGKLSGSIYKGKVKIGDTNFEDDLIRMAYHGVLDVKKYYWIASRYILEDSNSVSFNIYEVSEYGNFVLSGGLLKINSSDNPTVQSLIGAVRPIITVQYP